MTLRLFFFFPVDMVIFLAFVLTLILGKSFAFDTFFTFLFISFVNIAHMYCFSLTVNNSFDVDNMDILPSIVYNTQEVSL